MQAQMQQHSQSSDSQESDMLYQENRAYSESSAQHESSSSPYQQQKQDQEQKQQYLYPYPQPDFSTGLAAHPSSSSLGQISNTQLRSSPIAIVRPSGEKGNESTGFETDEDEDSEVDLVERDAMRLRRKYGDKVIVATSYQSGLTKDAATSSSQSRFASSTMLKAPYLGSLSKSENFLMPLPPISLSDENSKYQYEEPPTEVGSYGSLRESHQRGKFLDGPSSYREPRSGQIRKLDPPARPGAGLSQIHQQAMSIGERIAQAQKQKGENGDAKVDESEGTSRLSMMMDEAASKQDDSRPKKTTSLKFETSFHFPDQTVAPHELSAFDGDDVEPYDKFNPPTMMSTSLTAFEVLKSSSKKMAGYHRNHTQQFVQRQQEQNTTNTTSNRDNFSASAVLPFDTEVRQQHFQPLSRSLSDPTPHHWQRSPILSPTIQQLDPSQGGQADAYWTNGFGPIAAAQNTAAAPDQLENPDTDAAFDMDME